MFNEFKMGKLITYVSILIFIDLLFIVTGQLDITSPTSVVINAILDPAGIKDSTFWLVFLGAAGIAAIAATAGVTTGIVTRGIDILAFSAMAITLGALIGDFIGIYNILKDYNVVLATFIMLPVMAVFIMTVVEWLRGKD